VRTVYLGSSDFAVEVLKALAASSHRPALVVAPPDRPKGRGRRLGAPPTALAARELGVDLFQTPSVNDPESVTAIEASAPEAVCICQFGQLIKEPLLSSYLMLNVHPSLLPRWRGAAPIERALMAGDRETGVTIFRVEVGLDSGPIALAAAEPIHPDDTAGTISARLAVLGGRLLVEALDRAEAGTLELIEQDEGASTYASKIAPDERLLDPHRPAAELERIVRALTPAVGAYVALPRGERLGVSAARALDETLAPGALRASDGRVLMGCAQGVLELLDVRPPGGRTMPAADFLRGHRLPERVET
jgi:methionyl-tRNA formyltransferase